MRNSYINSLSGEALTHYKDKLEVVGLSDCLCRNLDLDLDPHLDPNPDLDLDFKCDCDTSSRLVDMGSLFTSDLAVTLTVKKNQ